MLPPSLQRQAILRHLQTPYLGFELLESRNLLNADLVLQPEIDQPAAVLVETSPAQANGSSANSTRLVDEYDELIELLAKSRHANMPSPRSLIDSSANERVLDADEVDCILESW
jgi:hypothetical protein